MTVIFTFTNVQNFSKYVLIYLLSRTNEKSVYIGLLYMEQYINVSRTHLSIYFFSPDDLNTLSIISDKYSVKKSPVPASEFREQGNLSFKVKDYTSAALFYSKVRELV